MEIKGRRTSKNFTKSRAEIPVKKKADIWRFLSAINVLVNSCISLTVTSHLKGSSAGYLTRISKNIAVKSGTRRQQLKVWYKRILHVNSNTTSA